MGYDMMIENTPEDEAAQLARARAAFHAAIEARDALALPRDHPEYRDAQGKAAKAYEALREADTSYFRLNIWAMGRYLAFMDQLGMITDDYLLPPWPHEPEELSQADIEAAEEPTGSLGTLAKPAAVAYVKQREAHLVWHPEPVFGIALHKFASNDGWLVTSEEIEAALESYRTHGADEIKVIVGAEEHDYWIQWIAYLERARHRGGFRVW